MVVERPHPRVLATTFSPRTTSTGMLPLFLTTPTTLILPSEPANGGCAITFIGLPAYTCCTVTMLPHDIQITSRTAMLDSALNLMRAPSSLLSSIRLNLFLCVFSSFLTHPQKMLRFIM